MRYPSPQRLLFDLARRGPSTVRIEALRLLGLPNCPTRWPLCARRSRASLLRRLAANKKKAAKIRLACLKELLWGLTLEQQRMLESL
jgi:hypothetical protein